MPIFRRIYEPSRQPLTKVHLQEFGLLFVILAMGVRYGLELPMDDPAAAEYFTLAKTCLSQGDFLTYNSIVGVQALVSRLAASADAVAHNGSLSTVGRLAS